MNTLDFLSQVTLQTHRGFYPGQYAQWHPMLALFGFVPFVLGLVIVGAVVFAAWKVGAYYDALRKKL